MGKFGEVTVGRIGCFKSDTIFLPSISYIALDRKREIDAGGGSQGVTTPHSGASYTHVQGSKLEVVRWPEATKSSAGPLEHWVAEVRQATEIFRTKIV